MDLIDFNEEKRNIFQTSDISKNVFKLYVTFMSLQTLETDFNNSKDKAEIWPNAVFLIVFSVRRP